MKMLPKNTKSNSHFLVLVLVSTYNLRNTDCASVKEFNNPQQQLKKKVLKLLQIINTSLHVHNTKTNFLKKKFLNYATWKRCNHLTHNS